MFLILSHLNKFRFGREPATALCWLESDRHSLNRGLGEPDRIGTDRLLSVALCKMSSRQTVGKRKIADCC